MQDVTPCSTGDVEQVAPWRTLESLDDTVDRLGLSAIVLPVIDHVDSSRHRRPPGCGQHPLHHAVIERRTRPA